MAAPLDLFDQFETQLRADEYDEATETLGDISDAYDEDLDTETTYARTLAARRQSVSESDREQFRTFADQAMGIEGKRTKFLMRSVAFLVSPDSFEKSDVLDSLETLRTAEQDLQSSRSETESTVESVTIPPTVKLLSISGPDSVEPGESASLTVVLANTGDDSAEGVEVSLAETVEGLAVSPDTVTVGDLAAGERTRETVTVTGESSGTYGLGFTADSSNAGDGYRSVTVEVPAEDTGTGGSEGGDDGDGTDGGTDGTPTPSRDGTATPTASSSTATPAENTDSGTTADDPDESMVESLPEWAKLGGAGAGALGLGAGFKLLTGDGSSDDTQDESQ